MAPLIDLSEMDCYVKPDAQTFSIEPQRQTKILTEVKSAVREVTDLPAHPGEVTRQDPAEQKKQLHNMFSLSLVVCRGLEEWRAF